MCYRLILRFCVLRVRPWSGRSEVQISGRSNRTQCCLRLATVATFLRMELCCPGAMTRRWAPPTRYTFRRNTASIMKDLIRRFCVVFRLFALVCIVHIALVDTNGSILYDHAKYVILLVKVKIMLNSSSNLKL